VFLSIIIPLYNCENYISHCLDCIFSSQLSFKEFEVIIINDGSKDNGPLICQNYAKRYSNIKFLSQVNQGASAARNKGLDAAQGDYIWFVDGDDNIISSFLNKAYIYLQDPKIDLLCFNHKKVGKEQKREIWDFHEKKELSGVEFLKGHFTNFIWNKIYKKKSLREQRFLNGTKNIEDMLFNMMTIIDMNHVLCISEFGYEYNCVNMLSTSRNPSLRNLVKLDQDSITVLTTLNNFAKKQIDSEKKFVLTDYLKFSIAGHLFSLFKFYSPQRLKKRIKYYRQSELYPVKKSSNKRGNKFLLLANHETLFLAVMRLAIMIKTIVDKKMTWEESKMMQGVAILLMFLYYLFNILQL